MEWGVNTQGVTVSLLDNSIGTGNARRDSFQAIEGLIGSSVTDKIEGNNEQNVLLGLEGDDSLAGLGGDDQLYGDSGNDTLDGGSGDDQLWGGAGADALNGQDGTDTARYDYAPAAVEVFLTAPLANLGEAQGDSFAAIENLTGSGFNDLLSGDNAGNTLSGLNADDTLAAGAGDDALYGGNGDDILIGGLGADYMDGGLGFNYASYADAAGPVFASLAASQFNMGDAAGDVYLNIQGLVAGGFGGTLMGAAGANVLIGGAGNDVLYGGAGDDRLYGGFGDESFFGDAGADWLDGGPGYDYARYDNALAGVVASLTSGGTGGDAAGDAYVECEALLGSGHADVLAGDGGNNVLSGNAGDDVLAGLAAIDSLFGGDGADILNGGAGADALYGGNGADEFRFASGEGGDMVYDFSSGVDRVALAAGSYGGGLVPGGSLDGRFVIGTVPTSSLGQFLYDPNGQSLSWDADGIGAGGAELITGFQVGATLTQQDLWLV
ncbi:calcium-binding protein [Sediminicoccus sp. KRV36]|uniref:calcium-binding protein n=1 Tax=Sediminicoccus sp. KRV36 TaxID=3133721 RepID=UPI00200CEA37|nr:calcium-binding protein [Sediminicoccus rosea]